MIQQNSRHNDVCNQQQVTRSNPVYNLQDQWYFDLRELQDVGPFQSYDAANCGLAAFKQYIKLNPDDLIEAISVAKNSANNYGKQIA